MKNNLSKLIIIVVIVLILNKLINFSFNYFLEGEFLKSFNDYVIIFTKFILCLSTLGLINYFKIKINYKLTLIRIAFIFFVIISSYYLAEYLFNNLVSLEIIVSEKQVFMFLFSALAVGLFEELFFRVFVYKYLIKLNTGVIKSTFFTSLIFAFAHLGNLFNSDYFVFSVIIQIIFAFGIGFILQSILLKSRSLILVSFLHGIINFFGMYKSKFDVIKESKQVVNTYEVADFLSSLISVIILSGFLTLIGFLMIRSEKKNSNYVKIN